MSRWPYIRMSTGFTAQNPRPRPRTSCRDRGALPVDPVANDPIEDGQGHQARPEHGVVETADREPVAEGLFGFAPHALDLEPPDHVRERLTRGHGIAIDLGHDLADPHRRVLGHVVDGLLAAPAKRVHPGVD